MDSESLKLLQNEINFAINDVFNKSNLSEIFKEYDFIVDKSIKVEYVIELTRLQSHNGIKNQEINGSSQAIIEEQFVTLCCKFCDLPPWSCCSSC